MQIVVQARFIGDALPCLSFHLAVLLAVRIRPGLRRWRLAALRGRNGVLLWVFLLFDTGRLYRPRLLLLSFGWLAYSMRFLVCFLLA